MAQTLTEILTKAGIGFGPALPGTHKREWFDAYGEKLGVFNGWPEVEAFCKANADYADDTGPNIEMRVLCDFQFARLF
jgi:hypothetical protein